MAQLALREWLSFWLLLTQVGQTMLHWRVATPPARAFHYTWNGPGDFVYRPKNRDLMTIPSVNNAATKPTISM
jgi:hypothetical protein